MNPEVLWISGAASVRQAASLMRDQSIGILLVSGDLPDRFVGVVTDRDLAIRACAQGLSVDDTPVSAVATPDVFVCLDIENLKSAEERMRDAQASRLIVVNSYGHPVGILSLTNILHGDRSWRALKTARGVLRHEAEVPHPPLESIKLTPSTPEDEEAAMRQQTVHPRGSRTSMKEFPG
jgi:CBS domain-containing protein